MPTKPWFRLYAENNGLRINEDFAELTSRGLEENKKTFGARYCPCKVEKKIENVCPCRELRIEGTCTCGLFMPKE